MPLYLAVYEDTSPFFTYAGQWRAGSSNDNTAEQYSESSFTVTQSNGASFSFNFYGTEVGIFGSKRVGHGAYQASVDGVASPNMSGDPRNSEFKASLFNATMQKGWHNVTLFNRENRFLDVDFVSWMASVGRDDEPLIVNTWQDSHPAFEYSPPDGWSTKPPLIGMFSGGDGHVTSTVGASATLTFKGDAIALYGPAGPNVASSYSVQVNKNPPTTHSGFKQFFRSRQLLYYGANLGPGTHKITLKLDSISDRTQMLAIDYAEIYTTKSLGGRFEGAAASAPPGLIAGAVILGILSLISLGVIAFFFVLYRKGRFDFSPSRSSFNEGVEGGVNWRESTYRTHRSSDFVLGPGPVYGGADDIGIISPQSTSQPSGRSVFVSGESLPGGLSESNHYSVQTSPSMSTNPSQPPAFPLPSKRVLLALNEDSENLPTQERTLSAPPPAYMS